MTAFSTPPMICGFVTTSFRKLSANRHVDSSEKIRIRLAAGSAPFAVKFSAMKLSTKLRISLQNSPDIRLIFSDFYPF
jgi:hypothetical protein